MEEKREGHIERHTEGSRERLGGQSVKVDARALFVRSFVSKVERLNEG